MLLGTKTNEWLNYEIGIFLKVASKETFKTVLGHYNNLRKDPHNHYLKVYHSFDCINFIMLVNNQAHSFITISCIESVL